MALHDNELAKNENGSLLVRTAPMRLRWEFADLVSSDGHKLRCVLSCSVRAIDRPAEQKLLAEVFLAKFPVATDEHVAAHFQTVFRSAAAAVVGKHPAERWLDTQDRSELAEALRRGGLKAAFSCGLEVLAPFSLELSSPTVEQQRVEAMQRTLAERRFEGQLEHFQRAAELLKQFEELRENNPGLSPWDLLKQISPADQGAMLQMLMLAKGRAARPSTLWAVAGANLVKVETSLGRDSQAGTPREARPTLAPLSPDLGPLRSVQPGQIKDRRVLLVGARSGVMVADPSDPNDCTKYHDSTESQLGFSRAIVFGDEIWACHSEAGLVAWTIGDDKPRLTLRPGDLPIPATAAVPASSPLMTMSSVARSATSAPGTRNLQAIDDDRVIFSSGCALLVAQRDGSASLIEAGHRSEIIAILPEGQRVAIVYEDGLVELRSRDTLASISQTRAAGRLSTATTMPWLGASRLLLATADGPVFCLAPDDLLVTQYTSAYRGLRAIAAADDVIAAISPDRQRLVLWNPWDPQRPAADLPLFPLARHRLADVDIG